MTSSPISIYLVEDHAGFAQALTNMLEQQANLKVVAVAHTAEQALAELPELDVDLVLVDYSLPETSGLKLMQQLHEQYPDLRCAMLSGYLSMPNARRALEAGARGYMIKDDPMGIIEGVRRIIDGEIYLSAQLKDFRCFRSAAGNDVSWSACGVGREAIPFYCFTQPMRAGAG